MKKPYRDPAPNTRSPQGQTIGSFKAMKTGMGSPATMRAAAGRMPPTKSPSRWTVAQSRSGFPRAKSPSMKGKVRGPT